MTVPGQQLSRSVRRKRGLEGLVATGPATRPPLRPPVDIACSPLAQPQEFSGNSFTPSMPNGGTLSGTTLLLSSGSSQYLSLPSAFNTKLATLTDFTCMAWITPVTVTSFASLWAFGQDTSNYILTTISGSTGTVSVGYDVSSSYKELESSSTLTAGST